MYTTLTDKTETHYSNEGQMEPQQHYGERPQPILCPAHIRLRGCNDPQVNLQVLHLVTIQMFTGGGVSGLEDGRKSLQHFSFIK